MVSERKRNQTTSVTLTYNNYQQVLVIVLRGKNPSDLKKLTQGAVKLGIAPESSLEVKDSVWEPMLHKLRAVHPQLTVEERESSRDWCLRRGVYPGGHFDHE